MASRESPGSPLSSVGTAPEESDRESIKHESRAQSPTAPNLPPSKRRRTGAATWDRQTPLSSMPDEAPPPGSPTASISSDTDGDIPNSPSLAGLLGNNQDDDYSGHGGDQVTVCLWDGCTAGDLGNMDGLVQHIHHEHIGSRQKRYSCEWTDCSRKGQTHASAYALRAHMRSHTREKPFYCTLPECDRNFTRSDALTKHMRSVHEIDALRSADTKSNAGGVPGSIAGTPASKLQRIRLKLSNPPREPGADGPNPSHPETILSAPGVADAMDPDDTTMPELSPEQGFDESELSLSPRELYRLLRRQIFWAERESAKLRAEWDDTRPKRESAWREKNGIFDDLIDGELRLFSALVSSGDVSASSSTDTAGLSTSLEKLQKQHLNFQRQQGELVAKELEKEEEEAAQADADMEIEPPAVAA